MRAAINLNLEVSYYSDTNHVFGPAQVTSFGDCSVRIGTKRLPVSSFPLGFALNLGTKVSVGAINQDLVSASGQADFFDTLTLKSISVFDATGAPDTDPNVDRAESGVRYNVIGTAVEAVPEPGSMLLLGMGFVGLASRAWRSGSTGATGWRGIGAGMADPQRSRS